MNTWTGGQYSLYRLVFGASLCFHILHQIPWSRGLFSSPLLNLIPNFPALWETPGVGSGILILGGLLSLLFAVGWKDRPAAGILWYLCACLPSRNPYLLNPVLPYVSWLMLAHVFLPRAPYGSFEARGRADPGGGWRMPPAIFGAAWVLMAAGYSYNGWTKLLSPSWLDGSALAKVLENPLARPGLLYDLILSLPDLLLKMATWGALAFELGFAVLALSGRLRPWIWLAMLGMHLSLIVLIDFADLSFGMVMLHLFTFNPAWVPGTARSARDIIFYDGTCGLCHGAVRFILAEDREGRCFNLTPLQSQCFESRIPETQRKSLPDSIVVLTEGGGLLVKSEAVIHMLKSLGGYWKILGILATCLPCFLRDALYNFMARIRHYLFHRPKDACPILPPGLRNRFL